MGLSVGIDLGTTNSVAGVATAEGVGLVANTKGEQVHASVVSFPPAGEVIVGNEAKIRKATDPEQTVYSAKRLIGQNVRSPMVQLAMASLGYHVEEGDNQQPIIVVGDHRMIVPQVSALVLGYLKTLTEQLFSEPVTSAVITVPANFSDAQRQATKEAGRIAGLEVSRLVNEPTAAALAYGYGREMDQQVAVFDFGGGTFDLSVLKIDNDIFEVLATDGEFFLGGDDIDRIIAEFLAGELNKSRNIDPRPIPSAMNRLNIAAEQIKQYLSTSEIAGGTIDGIVVGGDGASVSIEFELSRRKFESMIEGYVDRTIDICRNVLTVAGLNVSDICDVIMVGGSTRIPLVQQRLAEFFQREPAGRINPDEVVAHGAAIQAAMLSGAVPEPVDQQAFQSVLVEDSVPVVLDGGSEGVEPMHSALLLDVTPETLRIATAGGYSEVFLEKNSPVPIERTKVFTTAHDNQVQVIIECSRGSAQQHADNELLGSLILDDIPPGNRGDVAIEVTFRVDPDCILHVGAKELRTGKFVEARLNVIGAPVHRDEATSQAFPEVESKKAAKERLKLEKKAAKERAKLEKKAL